MSVKSHDIPQLNTESCWNSNPMHLLGVPTWDFEKICHVSCSLLHLAKVQDELHEVPSIFIL